MKKKKMSYPNTPFTNHSQLISYICEQNKNIQINEITELIKWLCKTPKITTIRVNLLKTTIDNVKIIIENELGVKYSSLSSLVMVVPQIKTINEIPELLIIENINNLKNNDWNTTTNINTNNKEIIVDCICAASILRGSHLYAPGVLAMQSGTKLQECVNIYADLDGNCRKGFNAIYNSNNKLFIGTGCVKLQRYQLFGENVVSSGIAVEMLTTISGVPSIDFSNLIDNGLILLQNLPSIVCGRVLKPQPNDIILDMCAAPGNKTTHLAELINDTGIIIAIDKIKNKLNEIQNKIRNFNLKSIHCFLYDSIKACNRNVPINIDRNLIKNGPPYPKCIFNKILLDAPCSALGNRPQLKNTITTKMLQSFPIIQKQLFKTAIDLLQINGILVYSTCTIMETENENIVKWAIDNFPNIKLIPAEPIRGGSGWPNTGLTNDQRGMVQRFGPTYESICNPTNTEESNLYNDTIGFFIAKFIKIN